MQHRFAFGWVTLASLVSVAATARADAPAAPTDQQKAAARLLGTEGVKAGMAGDCASAVDKLSRAEALVHAPTTAVWLGQCQVKLGHLVAGAEVLNRVAREVLPSDAPKSWADAKGRAQTLFDATEPRIAKLTIHVDGAPASAAQVTVDGEAVPSVLLDAERPTDPGAHHVVATATGFSTATADVTLSESQSQRVSLKLEAVAAPATASATTSPATTSPATTPTSPTSNSSPTAPIPPAAPNRTAAIVTLAVGGVGVAVGSVFGILALGDKSRLDKANGCPSGCPATSQGDINAMHTDSILSTVGFAVGVVGVGIGTFLFVSAHGQEPAKTTGVLVQPWIGLGAAGVGGTFQ